MREFWNALRKSRNNDPRPLLRKHGWHPCTFAALLLLTSAPASAQFQAHPAGDLPKVVEATVAWGDYDNDGFLDLFIAGSTDTLGGAAPDLSRNAARIYRNNGDGTFTDIHAGLDPVYIATSAWGDYDNDGYLDIIYGGVDTANAQVTKLYHNNHDGTFTEVAASVHSASYGSVAWGDFNNDGSLDLVIGGFDSAGPVTKLYRNDGGIFTEVTNAGLQGVKGHSKLLWADFNNDGYQDIALCGRTHPTSATDPQPVTKVFFNRHGDGSFIEDTSAHMVGIWKGGLAAGDLNNDGRIDILQGGAYTGVTDNRDTSLTYLNNGDGTFTPVNPGIPGVIAAWIALGDYDTDGRLDALVKGYGSNSGIYHGNGNGTFTRVGIDQAEMGFGGAAWGDFNNDGYLDYIAAGADGRTNRDSVALFINVGPGTSVVSPYLANTRPGPPTTLETSVTDSSVRFSWHSGSDAQTPASGLTYNLRIGTAFDGSEVLSPLADSNGFRRVPKLGNTYHDTSWTVHDLPEGTYYWSVQSLDNSFTGSLFAAGDSFRIGPPPVVVGPTWYDDPENPYLRAFVYLLEPSVVYDSTSHSFDLWASDGYNVLHARSADGRDWHYDPDGLVQNVASDFGMSILYGVNVVRADSLYHMYVTNYRSDGKFDIGLMTSSDRVRWTKHPASPVISVGGPGSWNPTGASLPRVTRKDSLFFMAFNAGDYVHGYIGVATSRDGIVWEQYGGNPVITFGNSGAVDELAVKADGLTVANGDFHMAVRALDLQEHMQVFMYGSDDFFHWTKSFTAPLLVPGAPGSWNDATLNGGTLLFLNGNYHFWYNAQKTGQQGWSFGQTSTDSALAKPLTDIPESPPTTLPLECSLGPCYPNPFNPSTVIGYTVGDLGRGSVLVQLSVYDILGREVAVLVNEEKAPGRYEVTFNGAGLASGVYIYRLQSGGFTGARKMVLAR